LLLVELEADSEPYTLTELHQKMVELVDVVQQKKSEYFTAVFKIFFWNGKQLVLAC